MNLLLYLGPFPDYSPNVVILEEERPVYHWEQRVFKQTTILLALPPQRRERLALKRNDHPLHRHKIAMVCQSVVCHWLRSLPGHCKVISTAYAKVHLWSIPEVPLHRCVPDTTAMGKKLFHSLVGTNGR